MPTVDIPLRVIRGIVNTTLADMSAEFDALYPPNGRYSIPPERLLRALLPAGILSIVSAGGAAVGGADRF